MGYGPVAAVSAGLHARVTPPHRYGLVFSINRVSIPLGATLAGALLPTLSEQIGWRGSLGGVASVTAQLTALLQCARRLDTDDPAYGRRVPEARFFLRANSTAFAHPKRRILTQASLVFLAAQRCLAAFTVTFLIDEIQLSHLKAGAILAVAQSAGIVARLVLGSVSDRSSRRTLCIGLIGLLIATATGLAMLMRPTRSEHAVLALFLLYGARALGWNGVMLAELSHTTTQDRAGEVTGVYSALAFAGAMAGAALFSMLLGSAGYAASVALLSALVLACSVSLTRFDLKPVAQPHRPPSEL